MSGAMDVLQEHVRSVVLGQTTWDDLEQWFVAWSRDNDDPLVAAVDGVLIDRSMGQLTDEETWTELQNVAPALVAQAMMLPPIEIMAFGLGHHHVKFGCGASSAALYMVPTTFGYGTRRVSFDQEVVVVPAPDDHDVCTRA